MVNQSPRFGLNTGYTQGEDNWSHNDTVDLLDELAEKRDVIANRPASGTYDDEVFHATDENIYYRWDASGSSWNAVGGKGASGSPVPGTTHLEGASIGEASADSASVDAGIVHSALSHPRPKIDISTGTYDFLSILLPTTNKLVTAYRSGTSHTGNDASIVKRESYDGGLTWTDETTVFDSSYDDRNLGGGVTPGGKFVIFFIQYDASAGSIIDQGYITSDDEGDTWSSFTSIGASGWAVANPYGSIVETDSGNLLQPIYGTNSGDTDGEVWVLESTDGGATWSKKATISNSTGPHHTETDITKLSNGNLLAIGRKSNGEKYTQFSSTDGGSTWTNDGDVSFGVHSDVSPFVYTSGGQARFIGVHRANYQQHDGRASALMSYNWADESSITGSPGDWDTYTWFVTNAAYDNRLEGYPYVAEVNGENLIVFSWNHDGNSSVNLSVVSESAVKQAVDGGQAISYRFDGTQTPALGEHPEVIADNSNTAILNTSAPATSLTIIDIKTAANGLIPAKPNEVLLKVAVSGDGTAGSEARVDISNYTQDAEYQSVGTPAGDTSYASGMIRTQTLNGLIKYKATSATSNAIIKVLGWS